MLRRARELWRQKIGERTKYIDMNELIKLRQVSHKSKDAKERRIMKEAQFKQVLEISFLFLFWWHVELSPSNPTVRTDCLGQPEGSWEFFQAVRCRSFRVNETFSRRGCDSVHLSLHVAWKMK